MNYDYGTNKQKTISIRISSDLFDSITSIAKGYSISNSQFIRLLIEAYVNSIENEGV